MTEPTLPRKLDESFEAYCARLNADNAARRTRRTAVIRTRTPSHNSLWGTLTGAPKWEPSQQ